MISPQKSPAFRVRIIIWPCLCPPNEEPHAPFLDLRCWDCTSPTHVGSLEPALSTRDVGTWREIPKIRGPFYGPQIVRLLLSGYSQNGAPCMETNISLYHSLPYYNLSYYNIPCYNLPNYNLPYQDLALTSSNFVCSEATKRPREGVPSCSP